MLSLPRLSKGSRGSEALVVGWVREGLSVKDARSVEKGKEALEVSMETAEFEAPREALEDGMREGDEADSAEDASTIFWSSSRLPISEEEVSVERRGGGRTEGGSTRPDGMVPRITDGAVGETVVRGGANVDEF